MSIKKKILVIAPNTWSTQELAKRMNDYDFIFIEDQFQKDNLKRVSQILKANKARFKSEYYKADNYNRYHTAT